MDFDKSILFKGQEYYVVGYAYTHYVDRSFSHQFGVERCGREEVADFSVEQISLVTLDGLVPLKWEEIPDELRQEINEEVLGMEVF